MRLLREFTQIGFTSDKPITKINCKVYKNKSGALDMAKEYKYRPRKKFLNIKLHQFRDYVERGEKTIRKVSTHDQCADYLTKPLDRVNHKKHRNKVQLW